MLAKLLVADKVWWPVMAKLLVADKVWWPVMAKLLVADKSVVASDGQIACGRQKCGG